MCLNDKLLLCYIYAIKMSATLVGQNKQYSCLLNDQIAIFCMAVLSHARNYTFQSGQWFDIVLTAFNENRGSEVCQQSALK